MSVTYYTTTTVKLTENSNWRFRYGDKVTFIKWHFITKLRV